MENQQWPSTTEGFDGDLESQHALCSQILFITETFLAIPDKPQEGCLLIEAKYLVW